MYLDPVSLPALALWLDGAARGADLVSGTEHAGEELRRFSAWLAARLGRYDGYFVALLVERCAGDEEQAFHAFFVEWDAFQAPDD